MKIIKIKLEYRCFPVWIYNEKDELIDNDLPTYLIGDSEIDPIFVHIQEMYNGLYLDDGQEFRYIGFPSIEQKEKFFEEMFSAINLLRNKLSEEYIIEECTDFLMLLNS